VPASASGVSVRRAGGTLPGHARPGGPHIAAKRCIHCGDVNERAARPAGRHETNESGQRPSPRPPPAQPRTRNHQRATRAHGHHHGRAPHSGRDSPPPQPRAETRGRAGASAQPARRRTFMTILLSLASPPWSTDLAARTWPRTTTGAPEGASTHRPMWPGEQDRRTGNVHPIRLDQPPLSSDSSTRISGQIRCHIGDRAVEYQPVPIGANRCRTLRNRPPRCGVPTFAGHRRSSGRRPVQRLARSLLGSLLCDPLPQHGKREVEADRDRRQHLAVRQPPASLVPRHLVTGHRCPPGHRAHALGKITLTQSELPPLPGDQLPERRAERIGRRSTVGGRHHRTEFLPGGNMNRGRRSTLHSAQKASPPSRSQPAGRGSTLRY
jgi:hypothetical protein